MIHVSGDSAAALVLRLMAELGPDSAWVRRRVRLEHGDGLTADLWPLARRLGVVVVQNPSHLMVPPSLVAERVGAAPPAAGALRSLLAAGVPLALGSDGPPDPFLNVFFATTHALNPREALTREQAVAAYTRGSAYAEFAEGEKGTLAPGMLADLVVLSQDLFTVPAAIPATKAVLTLVGGRAVFDAGTLAAGANAAGARDPGAAPRPRR
jgi:hypothetical protein